MKATVTFTIEITDDDFESKHQKKLFEEASEESRQIWLSNKAQELIEYAEINSSIVKPIKYEL